MTAAAFDRLSTDRKRSHRDNSEYYARERRRWRARAQFFHEENERYLKFLIPKGSRVLEIGCGTGDTLAALEPSHGVGIDLSPAMIAEARAAHPGLNFVEGDVEQDGVLESLEGPFDTILLVDTIGMLDDVQALFAKLHRLCKRESRLVLVYYSHLWQPLLNLAEFIGLKMPQRPMNVFSAEDVCAIADLAKFEPIKRELRLLSPLRLLGLGRFANRFLSPLPLIRRLSLRHYTVCRSMPCSGDIPRSASVVIPARSERGNIEPAVRRLPNFCPDMEIIFVEGHSDDGTYEEMIRVKGAHTDRDIKVILQPGKGKADAVYAGFDAARGDVLMILDADLTMPPEQLPKFWDAIRSGQGEFINGSRLVYQMDEEAMRFLNLIANRIFSILFSWMLGQRYTDTLCGTKVIRRSDYQRLKTGRNYFGDFDPFGDFDLIFGAAKLSLKTVEVPVRYASRAYGVTKISRFTHGALLLRMLLFAFFKIKAL